MDKAAVMWKITLITKEGHLTRAFDLFFVCKKRQVVLSYNQRSKKAKPQQGS